MFFNLPLRKYLTSKEVLKESYFSFMIDRSLFFFFFKKKLLLKRDPLHCSEFCKIVPPSYSLIVDDALFFKIWLKKDVSTERVLKNPVSITSLRSTVLFFILITTASKQSIYKRGFEKICICSSFATDFTLFLKKSCSVTPISGTSGGLSRVAVSICSGTNNNHPHASLFRVADWKM